MHRLHRYFQPTSCPELSYVIGAVLGDGYVTEDRGRGIVGFTNKDKFLLEHFLVCISRILNTRRAGRITSGTRYGVLKATVGSRLLFLFLKKPLAEIAPFIEQEPAAFISGFFDAEGHATVALSHGRLSVIVGASNTDLEVLEYIFLLLRRRFGITCHITASRRRSPMFVRGQRVEFPKTLYRLSISRFADVQTFMRTIGFTSKQKQNRLEDGVYLLRTYGSRRAAPFWHRSYTKMGSRWCKIAGHVVDGGPGET